MKCASMGLLWPVYHAMPSQPAPRAVQKHSSCERLLQVLAAPDKIGSSVAFRTWGKVSQHRTFGLGAWCFTLVRRQKLIPLRASGLTRCGCSHVKENHERRPTTVETDQKTASPPPRSFRAPEKATNNHTDSMLSTNEMVYISLVSFHVFLVQASTITLSPPSGPSHGSPPQSLTLSTA